MGIVEGMVAFGFLIVVVLIASAMIPDLFGGLLDALGNTYTATTLVVKPEVDEIICDLFIEVKATLDQEQGGLGGGFLSTAPFVKISTSDSHDYTWYNCVARSQYTTNDLINAGGGVALINLDKTTGLQTNDITGLFGENRLILEIELIDSTDPTQRIESTLQPQLKVKKVWAIDQTIKTPANVNAKYVISDIPVRNYILLINADDEGTLTNNDFKINDLSPDQPFRTIICDEFSQRQGTQCIKTQ